MQIKIGTEIGNWKVITEKYRENNIYWNNCECICGLIKPIRTWHLNNNKTKGCGCTNIKGRFKAQCIGELSKSYYGSFKYGRLKKGILFNEDVTMEFLWELFLKQDKKCAISGINLQLNPRWSKQNQGKHVDIIQNASLDRINSNEGYTKENIQWVHKDINMMKGSMNEIDFISFCKQVYLKNSNKELNLDFNGKLKWYGGS